MSDNTTPQADALGSIVKEADGATAPVTKAKAVALCHPDSPHYSRGWCKKCYERKRKLIAGAGASKGGVPDLRLSAGIDSPAAALGAHVSLSQVLVPPPPPRPHFDLRKKTVLEFVAKAVIVEQLDYTKAVEKIAPELTPSQREDEAEMLAQSKELGEEIEKQLTPKGLDDKAKDFFVAETWKRFMGAPEKERIAAMKLLGKAFIVDTDSMKKPAELPIKGLEAGLAAMLGGTAVVANAAGVASPDAEDDDDEDDDERPPIVVMNGAQA